ncbi:hypothetical protein TKK_0003658 [Trichogramma kaykai]
MFASAGKIALLTVLLCGTAVLSKPPTALNIAQRKAELKHWVLNMPEWKDGDGKAILDYSAQIHNFDQIMEYAEEFIERTKTPFDKYFGKINRKHPELTLLDFDRMQLAMQFYEETGESSRKDIRAKLDEIKKDLAGIKKEDLEEYKQKAQKELTQLLGYGSAYLATVDKIILGEF